MKFGNTNKIPQAPLIEQFGDTAKAFETKIIDFKWKVWLKAWSIGLAVFCITLFSVVFSVNLALWLL